MAYPRFRGEEKAKTYKDYLKEDVKAGKTKLESMSTWESEITLIQLNK